MLTVQTAQRYLGHLKLFLIGEVCGEGLWVELSSHVGSEECVCVSWGYSGVLSPFGGFSCGCLSL